MKYNFKFSNLLGTVYRSGNILFSQDGNSLICPVGNKLSIYDLAKNRSITLPCEGRYHYETIALSPDESIIIAAQSDGEVHVISLSFKRIIYRKKFESGIIKDITFSPNGKYFAITQNCQVLVYSVPNLSRRIYNPFSCIRTFSCLYSHVTSLEWCHDSNFLCFGSKDDSAYICTLEEYENFKTLSLAVSGSVVGCFFKQHSYDLVIVCRNWIVSTWSCSGQEDLIPAKEKEAIKDEDFDDDDDTSDSLKNTESKSKDLASAVTYLRTSKTLLSEFLKKDGKHVVSTTSYHKKTGLLVVAFTSGNFLLLNMLDSCALIHSLSIAQKAISSSAINSSGDWIALGVAHFGELLVWEWQSETHVLKQQGHYNSMKVVSFSPDGLFIATGGDDNKVKLWSTQTSFCFVTFSEHTAPVTGLAFTQSGKAIISSSLDGTVRAFDLIRYRNFKTMTSHKPTQFSCLSVDSSGELIVAGGLDNHDIFLWSLQTGKLLEIIGGHSGPVTSLQFSPQLGSTKLVSTSWDKTVKIWNAIDNSTDRETIYLTSEGVFLTIRPDGKQFAVATMNAHITFFNLSTFTQEANIEGQHSLGAGRENADKITAKSNLKSKFFTCLSYSSDGNTIIGAGKSKNICIFSVKDEILIKKIELTQNHSWDGMDKYISRKKLTENGLNLSLVEERKGLRGLKVPGCARGSLSLKNIVPVIQVSSLAFSRTGRSWAACSTEGLLLYSLDDDWLFDPLFLQEDITPNSIRKNVENSNFTQALMMALRLNITSLTHEVLESIPISSIAIVADSLTSVYIELFLKLLPNLLEASQHLGFYALWVNTLFMKHGYQLKEKSPTIISELSHLQKSLMNHYHNLSKVCSHNEYMLNFLLSQATLKKRKMVHVQPLRPAPSESSIMKEEEESEVVEENL